MVSDPENQKKRVRYIQNKTAHNTPEVQPNSLGDHEGKMKRERRDLKPSVPFNMVPTGWEIEHYAITDAFMSVHSHDKKRKVNS